MLLFLLMVMMIMFVIISRWNLYYYFNYTSISWAEITNFFITLIYLYPVKSYSRAFFVQSSGIDALNFTVTRVNPTAIFISTDNNPFTIWNLANSSVVKFTLIITINLIPDFAIMCDAEQEDQRRRRRISTDPSGIHGAGLVISAAVHHVEARITSSREDAFSAFINASLITTSFRC